MDDLDLHQLGALSASWRRIPPLAATVHFLVLGLSGADVQTSAPEQGKMAATDESSMRELMAMFPLGGAG